MIKQFYFDVAAGKIFTTVLSPEKEQKIIRSGRKNRVLTVFNERQYSAAPDTARPKGYILNVEQTVTAEEFYFLVKARFAREEKEKRYTAEYWKRANEKLNEAFREVCGER